MPIEVRMLPEIEALQNLLLRWLLVSFLPVSHWNDHPSEYAWHHFWLLKSFSNCVIPQANSW